MSRDSGRLEVAASRGADLLDAALEASVAGSFSRIGYDLRSRLLPEFTEEPLRPMAGQRALITGATSGIGLAAATDLASLGARVHFLARSRPRAERAREDIAAAAAGAGYDPDTVTFEIADLEDLTSVRKFAAGFAATADRLDVLIHNAGTIYPNLSRTADGIELTVASQLVAPFLLTQLMLGLLSNAGSARVITVSSGGMYSKPIDLAGLAATTTTPSEYNGVATYARVKRAQVAMNAQWSTRASAGAARAGAARAGAVPAPGGSIGFHAMHPGWVRTPGLSVALPGFARLMGPVLRNPSQGADTIVWLASAESERLGSGRFWHDRRLRSVYRIPGARPDLPGTGQRLWAWVAELADLDPRLAAGRLA